MAEIDTRGLGVRTCKACEDGFDFAYRRGRPRECCYGCQPPGTRMIGAVTLMDQSPGLRPLASLEVPQ